MLRPLLSLLLLYHIQSVSAGQCLNGCSWTVETGYPSPVAVTDDGSICEIGCAAGYFNIMKPTYNAIYSNLAYCSGGVWCTTDTAPSSMKTASNGAITTRCFNTLVHSVTRTPSGNCPIPTTGFTGVINPVPTTAQEPSTPTTTSTTSTTSTTTTTTTPTTTTTFPTGRCRPVTDSQQRTYANKCVVVDSSAVCEDDDSLPMCTCSAKYTDTFCGVEMKSLETLGNMGGDPVQVLQMITDSKDGAAKFAIQLPALLTFMTDDQRAEMSYEVEDIIKDASYEGKALDLRRDFTAFNDPSLGNCFTFNHYNSSHKYRIRQAGTRGGLRVLLSSTPNDYVPWVDTVGASIYVHPVGREIYVESFKYTSTPGGEDHLVLKKCSFSRLSGLFGKCSSRPSDAQSFYFNGEYSVDGCLRSCYQDSVMRECGCMDASYVRKEGAPSCRFDQLPCVSSMASTRGDPVFWPECRCLQPCYEEDFPYTSSRAPLSAEHDCTSPTSNISCSEQVSFVSVVVGTLEIEVEMEEEKYPLSRVMGVTGSLAGVLLGASIVFLFELLVLGVHVLSSRNVPVQRESDYLKGKGWEERRRKGRRQMPVQR